MVLRVARRGDALKRPSLHDRRVEHPARGGVIVVGMRKQDPAEASTPLRLGADRGDVALVPGPGSITYAGLYSDDVAVRARERHRAGIGRDYARDLGMTRGGVDDAPQATCR